MRAIQPYEKCVPSQFWMQKTEPFVISIEIISIRDWFHDRLNNLILKIHWGKMVIGFLYLTRQIPKTAHAQYSTRLFFLIKCFKDIICIAWSPQWMNKCNFFALCFLMFAVYCNIVILHAKRNQTDVTTYIMCHSFSSPVLVWSFKIWSISTSHIVWIIMLIDLCRMVFLLIHFSLLFFSLYFLIRRHQTSQNRLRADEKFRWDHRGEKQRVFINFAYAMWFL